MMLYRLTDRTFSRRWRRNKDYTEQQLKMLARHRGCVLEKFHGGIRVKKGGKCVASFKETVRQEEIPENRPASVYAALRNPAQGRVTFHAAKIAGQSHGG